MVLGAALKACGDSTPRLHCAVMPNEIPARLDPFHVGAPSGADSLCRQFRLIGYNRHGDCAQLGISIVVAWQGVLLDHRRHRHPQEGPALSWSGAPVLRSTGKARQLPDGGQLVTGKCAGQRARIGSIRQLQIWTPISSNCLSLTI